jgi:pyruvate formate lyase activating enzyme
VALHPLSLLDYTGKLSAVAFFAGCNFRCPFCHNPELVLGDGGLVGSIPWALVEQQLEARAHFLDAVTFSGGEPTLQPQLTAVLRRMRRLGLDIKLDTNGSRPEVLRPILEEGLVDYVAMDIKAPWSRYAELAGVAVDVRRIRRSMARLAGSGIDYELRTTVAPGLDEEAIEAIAEQIAGAHRYVLQRFVPRDGAGLLDPSWRDRPALDAAALQRLWARIASGFREGGVRGAMAGRAASAEANA